MKSIKFELGKELYKGTYDDCVSYYENMYQKVFVGYDAENNIILVVRRDCWGGLIKSAFFKGTLEEAKAYRRFFHL